ncbi:MAG: putative exopolysaccharide production protein [candidate division WS6 bacterium GW2011_GWF1_35_23]|uniref:Putative exopolysaccharide production protein n=1 Tax=candidate division WS6 bacterium GW2011_GWF1_35_23 TaxID=1619097 RepID=A0A0G0FEH8_9BACT|nr:MAG: putative exopolysaccharide production protein [candidate division WS6 bacterium GW2011_GWF1_35_23]
MLKSSIKRIFDILFSLIVLILFSPLLLICTLAIYLTDRKEIFVKEPLRLGRKGEFKMYKFRSMIPNAHNEIEKNPRYKNLKKRWQEKDGKLKLSEDSRVTWIGKIIRKTDIDELPQFLNVLKGDMSVVGPRPMYQAEVERYRKAYPDGNKYVKQILKIRPGITGIWQVSGRNEISFEKRILLDVKYSKEINLLGDLKILLRTPYVVLTRKGAYE